MTYPEAIDYLNSLVDYEKIPQYPYNQSFTLERVKEFLNTLNNPQDYLRCIHISGTKGKGSTCAFIAYILRQAHFKVGLYTSPHLSDFRERIRILKPQHPAGLQVSLSENPQLKDDYEGMISAKGLTDLVERLKPKIDKYNANSKYGCLTFFEVYTCLAFLYFKEEVVDFAVLETGLGGRLDATNTVNSIIAAITPISYEHTRQLGNSLTKIAREKAGIIKAKAINRIRSIIIVAPQEKEAIEVIRQQCRNQNAMLIEIGKDIEYKLEGVSQETQCFKLSRRSGHLTDLRIRLLGNHQIINATLAVGVVLALNEFYQTNIDLKAIRDGLINTVWPGRFEIVSKNPVIILDGAQNSASAQALKDTVIEIFPNKRIIMILGICEDKDIKGICQVLLPMSNDIILTKTHNPRAADLDTIEQNLDYRAIKTPEVREAIDIAKGMAGSQDLILITGSLFLVGEAREILTKASLAMSS